MDMQYARGAALVSSVPPGIWEEQLPKHRFQKRDESPDQVAAWLQSFASAAQSSDGASNQCAVMGEAPAGNNYPPHAQKAKGGKATKAGKQRQHADRSSMAEVLSFLKSVRDRDQILVVRGIQRLGAKAAESI